MRKIILLSFCFIFLFPAVCAYAQESIPLGRGMVALKVDYAKFSESDIKDFDTESGPYVGLEAFGRIAPNVYLGGEIGYYNSDGNVNLLFYEPMSDSVLFFNADTEMTYVPIEINVKYKVSDAKNTGSLVVGAGISYNYLNVEASAVGLSVDEDDWLFGAQAFLELNLEFHQFYFGINGKYQITDEMEIGKIDTDVNGNNWRVGGQIGIKF